MTWGDWMQQHQYQRPNPTTPEQPLDCLICTITMTDGGLWIQRVGAVGREGPFCSAAHIETWLTLDEVTRLFVIFGNLTRARFFLEDRAAGRFQQDTCGTVSYGVAGKRINRPAALCPAYPENDTGHSPGCPDCRYVTLTLTEIHHVEITEAGA